MEAPNVHADPVALAELIDLLEGRGDIDILTVAKNARKYLDDLLTQMAHRSQTPTETLTVALNDRDWVQMLGYIGIFKEGVAAANGYGAPEMPSYQIAEGLRQKILAQLKPQRDAQRKQVAPTQKIRRIHFNALPKKLQDRLDGTEDMAGIEEVRSGDKVEYKVRFEVGGEYWYKYYNADGTDAGGSVHYYAKDPEIVEAGNSSEAERGFY